MVKKLTPNENLFEPSLDAQSVDESLYGKIQIPESGREVASPTPILAIRPDLRQPRRTVPASIRIGWNGKADGVSEVLERWQALVLKAIPTFKLYEVLMGGGEGLEVPDDLPANIKDFLELCNVASSIHRDGLINPITITRIGAGDEFYIETGERRWLAHHLLANTVDAKKYAKVKAIEVTKADVWRQAAENGSRKPLNAIGMARQLALLIMDMYKDDAGVSFQKYSWFVDNGSNEREFYAQVSNGNVWRIKKGFAQRLLDVTGLKSISQIAQYRALINIPDELWTQADEENWTEFKIREYVDRLKKHDIADDMFTTVNISTPQTDPDTFTDVNVSLDNGHSNTPQEMPNVDAQPYPPARFALGEYVAEWGGFAKGKIVGMLWSDTNNTWVYKIESTNGYFKQNNLHYIATQPTEAPSQPPTRGMSGTSHIQTPPHLAPSAPSQLPPNPIRHPMSDAEKETAMANILGDNRPANPRLFVTAQIAELLKFLATQTTDELYRRDLLQLLTMNEPTMHTMMQGANWRAVEVWAEEVYNQITQDLQARTSDLFRILDEIVITAKGDKP